MTSATTNASYSSAAAPQSLSNPGAAICKIVGNACLAGFLVDIVVLAFPPRLGSLEWRVGFLQQLGDRSVILLFAIALLMYGSMASRRARKQLGLISLIVGFMFQMGCILAIHDGISLQRQAVSNIDNQASTIQTQIEKAQQNPGSLPQNISPDDLKKATASIEQREALLKKAAKSQVMRTGFASVGNLSVIGFALIALGRYSSRLSRAA